MGYTQAAVCRFSGRNNWLAPAATLTWSSRAISCCRSKIVLRWTSVGCAVSTGATITLPLVNHAITRSGFTPAAATWSSAASTEPRGGGGAPSSTPVASAASCRRVAAAERSLRTSSTSSEMLRSWLK